VNSTRIRTIARQLAAGPRDPSTSPPADADLLTRFLDRHDESAFEDLVARHLPAVRAVCRSVLRDPNDADDAVQATFLVLVRRAAVVRDRAALGGWLCRIAWRTANRLRTANARHAGRQSGVDPDTTPATHAAAGGGELADALHDEITRLPERYRLAVLTCYAAGTPTTEAARHLGWPKGTLLTRLAWARKRLRDRLTRRGITLAGGFTAAFAGRAGSAGAALFGSQITRAAVALAASDPMFKELVSERVSSLTEGVVRAMIATKLKIALGLGFLVVALLGLGLGRLTVGTADAANPGDKKPLLGVPAGAKASPKDEAQLPEPVAVSVPAQPGGPGNDLIVRRPLGSYTREVMPYGRATLTFTENRLHIAANIRIDKATFTVTADADYSMNRESMVYGIITAAEVNGPFDEDEAAEIALIASGANDMPFAFRVRADDGSITIKDIRFGALGSANFLHALDGLGDMEEMLMITSLIAGKYKTDPNPERQPPLPAPRSNQPVPVPKSKRQPSAPRSSNSSAAAPTAVPVVDFPAAPGAPPVGGAPYGYPVVNGPAPPR
jgi:RNA polymerase sigma factor (sigma-70 family)